MKIVKLHPVKSVRQQTNNIVRLIAKHGKLKFIENNPLFAGPQLSPVA